MKTIKLIAILLVAGTLQTFAQQKNIDIENSVVKWTGKKVGGAHNGEIQIKNGFFKFNNESIVGGQIDIDMLSITNTDIEDATYNKKLVGHLKSEDFFGVEKYPTSSFTITKASKFKNNKATVTGELTIKGKTKKNTFDLVKKGAVYVTQIKIDRSKYDVRYGSKSFFDNLGDKVIDDIFVLDIEIKM